MDLISEVHNRAEVTPVRIPGQFLWTFLYVFPSKR